MTSLDWHVGSFGGKSWEYHHSAVVAMVTAARVALIADLHFQPKTFALCCASS